MPSTSFGPSKRLRGKRGFEQLFRRGKVFREEGLVLYSIPNGLKTRRFGCSVRRAAAPKAFMRNRLKRWLREIFRRMPECVPLGLDVAIRVHRLPEEMTYHRVEKIVQSLCGRLRLPAD